jgi:cytochrome P450
MQLISEPRPSAGPRVPAIRRARRVDIGVDLTLNRTFTAGQPYAAFAKLRAEAPVSWHDEHDPREPGFWAVTRYADVMA